LYFFASYTSVKGAEVQIADVPHDVHDEMAV